MNIRRTLLCMAFLLTGGCFTVSAAQSEPLAEDQKQVINYAKFTMTAETFRKMAAQSQENVEPFLAKSKKATWRTSFKAFSEEQMRDFFIGALIYHGGFSDKKAVIGFYNPWWDTLLLTEYIMTESDIPKIEKFYFLAGETFRNEKISEIPDYSGVVSLDETPLAINVTRLQQKTLAVFNESYSSLDDNRIEEKYSLTGEKLKENLKAIQIRSALRLKQVSDLIKNKKHYNEAWLLAQMMRTGAKRDFKQIFTVDANQEIIRHFLELDPKLRSGFVPYGYITRTEQGKERMYVFVNSEVPRLYATASLGGGWRKTIFEWYDFGLGDRLLKIWNSRQKGVAK